MWTNTVFEAPSAFDKLWISGYNGYRVVSRERVRGVRCCREQASGLWVGEEIRGRFFAIFSTQGHFLYRESMATRDTE